MYRAVMAVVVLGLVLACGGCVVSIGNCDSISTGKCTVESVGPNAYMTTVAGRNQSLRVYDLDNNLLIYGGDIRRGQKLVFDGKNHLMTIDNVLVVELSPDNQKGYRITCLGK